MKTLVMNSYDRWQLGNRELDCGSVVEVEAFGTWLLGRIEHSPARGYYLSDPDTGAALELSGDLVARLPER